MKQRLISHLLHLANSDPPTLEKASFYALKERLLAKYGRMIGYDWQEIVKPCWRCEENGPSKHCGRCGGTGEYERFWVKLERWSWNGYTFHRPVNRTWTKPEEVTINGYIRHENHGHAAREAMLWLCLLCDWWLFRKLMVGSCYCQPGWWPLLRLQAALFDTSMFLRRFAVRRCYSCGRWVFRVMPRNVYQSWVKCRKCEQQHAADAARCVNEIPF